MIYEISFCYEFANKTEDSISYFQSYIDKYPFSKAAWFNLGIAYNNIDLYEKAIEAYDFAIAIDDNFSSAYFNKANSLANIGMYKDAIVAYKELSV